jgi:hypothetical protein
MLVAVRIRDHKPFGYRHVAASSPTDQRPGIACYSGPAGGLRQASAGLRWLENIRPKFREW